MGTGRAVHYIPCMDMMATERSTIWVAAVSAVALPAMVLVAMLWLSGAPDDYRGRMVVRFADSPGTTEAVTRIAAAGARPLRLIGFADAWVAHAEHPGAVPLLKAAGAQAIFRDLGYDGLFAGCFGLASGPARRPVPRDSLPQLR